MTTPTLDRLNDVLLEPERYEIHALPVQRARSEWSVSRRALLKGLGGGLVVMLVGRVSDLTQADAQETGGGRGGGRRGGNRGAPEEIGAWLHIAEDGAVTVYCGKAEVGQNIRTSLSQAVAEELRVPLNSVRMVLGDTDLTPYDAGTFGSRTTPTMNSHLRQVAAAAREMLIDMAAQLAGVDRATLTAEGGQVKLAAGNRSFAYGDLTKGQKLAKTVGGDARVESPQEWKVAGQPAPKADGRDFVTGRHQYASDVVRAGMLHGKVLRPSAFQARLVSTNTDGAKAVAGATVVHDGDFIGVVAPNSDLAQQAVDAIKADWIAPPQISAAQLFDHLREAPQTSASAAASSQSNGAPDAPGTPVRLQATYTVAYIAHAPMEPRAAVAEWQDGKVTVWTGTQRPFGVRSELAGALGLREDQVRVIVPDTGAGYGGKHNGEAAIEAARLSRAAGKPVKLVWTREEEFTWAYFRPAGVIDVRSAVAPDGLLTDWEFHNYNSGNSGIGTPYNVRNQKVEFHGSQAPLRQGSYRGLAATANHFARESHMDELAAALKMEPLQFRLKNLQDNRLRDVLTAAAERFGWGKQAPDATRGSGIAGGTEKGGYVATCAEVAIGPDRKVRVVRLVSAFDCGAVVNPDGLKNQVEGAAIMGLGGALFEAIDFADGKILNPHFARYRVPRFSDAPSVEAVLVDRKDLAPAGAGETPIVAVAPAIANAIFQATGQRLRAMPLCPKGVLPT